MIILNESPRRRRYEPEVKSGFDPSKIHQTGDQDYEEIIEQGPYQVRIIHDIKRSTPLTPSSTGSSSEPYSWLVYRGRRFIDYADSYDEAVKLAERSHR